MSHPVTSAKTPFNGECRNCNHVFAVCWLPMPMVQAADLMKRATCPKCFSRRIYPAATQEADG